MQETIRYILSFLLYGNTDALPLVGYTRDEEEAKHYKLVIRPSLNSPLYDPTKNWSDFLPEVLEAVHGNAFSEDTDFVSIACFFLSRAEEIIVPDRDEHGRFLAQHSLLGQNNLTLIPLLDEYSRHLLKRLNLPLPEARFSKINLTHDVDILTRYRHLRGFLGGIKRGETSAAFASLRHLDADPAWTFPWLTAQEKNFHTIYFLKAGAGKGLDRPQYDLYGHDFRQLLHLLQQSGATIGLHTSYAAGADGNLIRKERKTLEEALSTVNCQLSTVNRYHWLRCTTIDNMQQLADAGFTDDYTMGFADRAGFRLATSRPVRWINPKTLQLTPLTLHSLTVMDCTLSNNNYMNLTEEEAYYTCQQLFDKTRQNAGELNLLWHNSNLTPDTYHKSLYRQILSYIEQYR